MSGGTSLGRGGGNGVACMRDPPSNLKIDEPLLSLRRMAESTFLVLLLEVVLRGAFLQSRFEE